MDAIKQSPLAPQPAARISRAGLVCEADAARPHLSLPSILPLRSGAFLCVFRAGSGFVSGDGRIEIARSDDAGQTWQPPAIVWDRSRDPIAYDYRMPALTQFSDGSLLLIATRFDRSDPARVMYDPVTHGYPHREVVLFRSADDGRSWSTPQIVDLALGFDGHHNGPIIELSPQRWLMVVETWKNFDDSAEPRPRSFAFFSDDAGLSWGDRATMADGVPTKQHFKDARVIPAGAGRLLSVYWTRDRAADADQPIHWNESLDGGRTWTAPQPTRIEGQVISPAPLSEGRVLALYNLRKGPRPGVMALISPDGGRNWNLDGQIAIWDAHKETLENARGPSKLVDQVAFSFGKPDLAQMSPSEFLAAFWCTSAGRLQIRWCGLTVN